MQSKPLVRQTSKVDFHQAVFELLLLVLYKFLFQGLSGTTLFISMDYSYNPTSEPLLFGITYVMGFTSNHKWVDFNTIILDYKYLQYLKSPVNMTISENCLFEWKDFILGIPLGFRSKAVLVKRNSYFRIIQSCHDDEKLG